MKPTYKRVYFRIESGYMCGGMMDRCAECLRELEKQLEEAGWTVDVHYKEHCSCPELSQGKNYLYCHPTQVSGIVDVTLIKPLEDIFRKGENYIYRATDIYEEVHDFSWEELKQYHLEKNREKIELTLADAFKTKRSNLYKPVREVIEYVAEKFSVHTFLKKNSYIPADAEREAIKEIFLDLCKQGIFTTSKGKGGNIIARTDPRPEQINCQPTLF